MNITNTRLSAQYERASAAWPFIAGIERQYGLPPFCLFAVGSRETNLINEVGDNNHGHGVWQLDDRSHTIPAGFDTDVLHQAEVAAGMLAERIADFGEVGGYNAYNSGSSDTAATTDRDYGPDVHQRRIYLLTTFGDPWETTSLMLQATDPKNGSHILVDTAGGDFGAVFTLAPDCSPGGHYLGGLNSHPEWNAESVGQIVAAFHYDDGKTPDVSAYCILVRDHAGTLHPYRFPSDGSLKG